MKTEDDRNFNKIISRIAATEQQSEIEDLLAARGHTHGDFAHHAGCTQELKDVVERWLAEAGKCPENLPYIVRESLDMILHKIGRIVAGQAMFKDHWDDIAGYARLVSERIEP